MRYNVTRTYSRQTEEALRLLGKQIELARKSRKLTTSEVAERAGISRGLLSRIEKGDLKCEVGLVFEVATVVGVPLFNADTQQIKERTQQVNEKLTLLPKSIRKKNKVVDDEF